MKDLPPITSWEGFKAGDIITTYHKGYWQLISITPRVFDKDDMRFSVYADKKIGDVGSPFFLYKKIINDNFTKVNKSQVEECDASYCKKVSKESIQEMRDKYNQGCDLVISLLEIS